MKYLLISFCISFNYSYAASCCSGASSTSQIILGSAKSVVRLNFINSTVLADKNENLIQQRNYSQLESIRTLKFSFSQFLDDFWQYSVALPVVSKSRYQKNDWVDHQELGDVSVAVAYKLLPEYKRNFLFSKAQVFINYTLPNAPSLYTTKRTDLLDTTGTGHHYLSLGIAGFKRSKFGFTTMQFQVGHRFENEFTASENIFKKEIKTHSSNDYLISIINSNDIKNYSFSYGVNYNYISHTMTNNLTSDLLSATFAITRTINNDYDISLNYSDDFLLNFASNHTLAKSVGLSLITRIN